MRRPRRTFSLAALLLATACATPQDVKQATRALDDGYRGNLALMKQYRDTLESVNQLQRGWARYVTTRLVLSAAVESATMDLPEKKLLATTPLLGDDVVAWVNEHRLAGLPARATFAAGRAKVDDVMQGLPALASLVRRQVDADLAAEKPLRSLAPYDEYARRIAVLRNANAGVRAHLDADVTVSPDDVREIADAIKQLRSAR